ncbi:uncharacterized protein PSFLO_01545 [Pseudozyma flocculosa]|uniref:Uncharacterized protein n=1 Tax=Pseudozyma flocculosa TaxID=84751 RepID=A0A5C3EUS3_9BASI|nr:uncharacterized protein PSFLO_01545 [Pseudozyma flocculosa]
MPSGPSSLSEGERGWMRWAFLRSAERHAPANADPTPAPLKQAGRQAGKQAGRQQRDGEQPRWSMSCFAVEYRQVQYHVRLAIFLKAEEAQPKLHTSGHLPSWRGGDTYSTHARRSAGLIARPTSPSSVRSGGAHAGVLRLNAVVSRRQATDLAPPALTVSRGPVRDPRQPTSRARPGQNRLGCTPAHLPQQHARPKRRLGREE